MDLLSALAFLAGLSIALALLLAFANRWLKVDEDPRIDVVTDTLPGANCGACGLPGCRAFAEKVVGGEILPGQCPVGGPATAQFIANLLGIEAGSMEKKVARLLCAGGSDVAVTVGDYEGYASCRAAATVAGGFKGCTFGCLGLGDCEVSCTFDAIKMAPNGLPVVDLEACTACGDCVRACPKDLFQIFPVRQQLLVQCKNVLEGEAVTEFCQVGCTGCTRCAADAPEGLIDMAYNLPVIHLDHLELQTEIATYRCPTDAIVWIEGQQFPELHRTLFAPKEPEVKDRVV
jgi:electron transport complex protein RnfB